MGGGASSACAAAAASARRERGVRDSGGAGGRFGMFFIAATSAAIVCSAAWRADTEMVLAFADRAAAGMAPASPRDPIPGATTGLAGAIIRPPAGVAEGGAGADGVLAGGSEGLAPACCAPTGVTANATMTAAIPATATVRIYFFADAGAGAGGGGTGSENITRPLTSS